MRGLGGYIRDERGASAVEFALIIPVATAFMLSVLHMSMVLYSAVSLHFATEETARCLAVSANVLASAATATTPCPSSASVQTYGAARYVGPNISAAFVAGPTGTCTGTKQVCATGTYNMSMGFASVPFTISAKAYYPHS